jgi:hypothetical protein
MLKKLISQHKLDITAKWICYSKTFEPHIGRWALPVKDDMILNTSSGVKYINDCDFIIYQHITKETSEYFNATNLKKITNNNCKHITLVPINIDNVNGKSFNKLLEKEKERNVTIKISEIIKNNPNKQLMLNHPMHPSTFFFIKCLKLICKQINIPFFKI